MCVLFTGTLIFFFLEERQRFTYHSDTQLGHIFVLFYTMYVIIISAFYVVSIRGQLIPAVVK